MSNVFLHCGLHKTGTTSIQLAFDEHRALLRQHGLLYPTAGLDTAHHNVAWELAGDRRFDPAACTVASVLAEIAAFDGDAVVSSEDFESVLHRPDALAALLDPLRRLGREVCVVVYVRDQTSYRESLYVELIEHGLDIPFAAVRDEIATTGALRWRDWVFHFDYDRMEAALRALPDTRIILRTFEQAVAAGSAICDLLSAMERPADLLGEAAFARVNARAGAEVILGMFCAARLGRALTSEEQEMVERLGRGARLVDRAVPIGSVPAYQLVRVCSQRTAEEVARIAALPAEARPVAEAALTRLWAAPPAPPMQPLPPAAAPSPPRRPRIGSVRHLLRRALGR